MSKQTPIPLKLPPVIQGGFSALRLSIRSARARGRIRQIVEQTVVKWGFCGIKVHRMDSSLTREICELAKVFHLPVLYDVVGQPDLIDLLASEYPEVNFIIPHLGSFADDWRAHIRVIDQITRFKNVYTDTAGVRRFNYLWQAIQRVGAHKVLFGSDGP